MHQQPKPIPKGYSDLISEIKKGQIKIPKFQRSFVWGIDKTVELLDSILKGYPIGAFILWETAERLKEIKKIGSFSSPSVPDGTKVQYVLDGQQRITSLFAALTGEKIQKEGEKKVTDYSKIYVDLDADIDEGDSQIVVSGKPDGKCITLHELLNAKNRELRDKGYSDTEIDKIHDYKDAFTGYDFSTIVLHRDDIDVAIEVFTRINTGGQKLGLFEIMSAKTYDEEKKFDMERDFQELLGELRDNKYGKIASQMVLNVLALVLKKECKPKAVLNIEKKDIFRIWKKVIIAIKESIDYFRTTYDIPSSSLLPYDALIVPFAYFIYKKGLPKGKQIDMLEEFFWKMSLSHRYKEGVGAKLGQDIKRIDLILEGKNPTYDDIKIRLTSDDLIKTDFRVGDSFCKAILCLLASQKPKEFNNSQKRVVLDNLYLNSANSKNYHHFFPKAYLGRKKIKNENSIVNITLVSDRLNKSIGDKAPSEYIKEYLDKNRKLPESIKSHLIGDIGEFGITTDNYDTFLKKRAEVIHGELMKKIRFPKE